MKERNRLSKLSRMELVELIYEIRRENVTLSKRNHRLEKQLATLQAAMEAEASSEDLGARLDSMENMLRDIRRQLRSPALTAGPEEPEPEKEPEPEPEKEFFRGIGRWRD